MVHDDAITYVSNELTIHYDMYVVTATILSYGVQAERDAYRQAQAMNAC